MTVQCHAVDLTERYVEPYFHAYLALIMLDLAGMLKSTGIRIHKTYCLLDIVDAVIGMLFFMLNAAVVFDHCIKSLLTRQSISKI
jgi:hypothetical protein